MKRKKTACLLIISIILPATLSMGCGQRAGMHTKPEYGMTDIPPEAIPLSLLSETMAEYTAGTSLIMNYAAEIDASNTKDGYITVRYIKKTHKTVKAIVKGPDGTPYIYTLRADREYEVLPLSEGNGDYQIAVYENVIDNKYTLVLGTTQSVLLTDEFAPFIRPNQYVDYNRDSKAAAKAAKLTNGLSNTEDKIAAIYNYVIKNITYDYRLAAEVQSGYIPDVDKVLKSGKGICFDYAALTTAMLRSQGIPAKLVVGYSDKAYHAWTSVYSEEKGWQLLDTTFASNSMSGADAYKYIGSGNKYLVKYVY